MPETEPHRAWQNFTFTAKSGHVRQVDLFIATPAGLFLIEVKSHPGTATNQGGTWIFRGDRTRTVENPLHLADQKAKELKEQLQWAAHELKLGVKIPFIHAAVFLSAPDLRCRFDATQRLNVYGRDGLRNQTGLPGIWEGLLTAAQRRGGQPVTPRFAKSMHQLRQKIGVQGPRKHRRVGPFELESRAFDTGPTWQDYLGENTSLPGDQTRRVRIYLAEQKPTRDERESIRSAARREYLALQGISHDGIVQAELYSDEHEAGPSIVFRHGKDWQRLDHFMIEHGPRLPLETRVEMVRQLAEAVDHAHRRHLYHRALAARSVYVEMAGDRPLLRICDWQLSARPDSGSSGHPSALNSHGSLADHIESSAGVYLAPEFGSSEADGTQLDVFGLGALSHLLLTGKPPAASRKERAKRLAKTGYLVPSAISDEISPAMDDLVQASTAVQPVDRCQSVRDVLNWLELVEEEITAPDRQELPDLLEVSRGTVIDGWRVEHVLGKGSTAKALLVSKDGDERVLKVALSGSGRQRLEHEAAQLRDIRYSHIVRLIEGPLEVGKRTVLVLERAGEQTLAQYLRREGRLTVGDLETLGEHLFQAVDYLESQDVRHRDIKPDNLGIQEVPKKGRRLVLFDFSLADASDHAIEVGTRAYRDPFLGTDRRPAYDTAAEHYAVAVTLHEMASAELPSWGDGLVDPKMLPQSERLPQLAEDCFDPLLRTRLVSFFRTALHRDPAQRYGSLRDMSRAWSDVFRTLDEKTSVTTPETLADVAPGEQDVTVTPGTKLVTAGLSARALSTALQQLDVSTVGELVKIPAARIQRLRGVGLGPRNELVKRAREWREQLAVNEKVADVAKVERETVTTDLSLLGLDEVADLLVPKGKETAETRVIRLVLALPDADGRPARVSAWASYAMVAEQAGLSVADVRELIGKARERWSKSVKAVTALRTTVLEILHRHGRVMETGQLAAALLAARGSSLDDSTARLALAQACVRAAIETEEHLDNPRIARRRASDHVLVAAVAEDDPTAASDEELLDYAVALGERADRLVDLGETAPLPGAATVLNALSAVPREGMPALSDTDLVSLAAAASRNAAVTARLELYPKDLDPKKALTLAQAVGYLGHPGIEPRRLRDRVLARFPELTELPPPEKLRALLREMGHDVEPVTDERGTTRYVLSGTTQVSSLSSSRWPSNVLTPAGSADDARRRLTAAANRGGFLVVKAWLPEALAVREELRALPGVTALDVTSTFMTALREIVTERGKPRWESVLAADTPDASPAARTGFGRLRDLAWTRVAEQVRTCDGAVLLHDATPLTRYRGGAESLARLAAVARQADESPHGLWLLCPMEDPRGPARLDGQIVATLGENEQLAVPRGFLDNDTRRAS